MYEQIHGKINVWESCISSAVSLCVHHDIARPVLLWGACDNAPPRQRMRLASSARVPPLLSRCWPPLLRLDLRTTKPLCILFYNVFTYYLRNKTTKTYLARISVLQRTVNKSIGIAKTLTSGTKSSLILTCLYSYHIRY